VGFRDTRRPHRPGGRILPSSSRVSLARTQRGVWPALCLPRVEVRRCRQLCGQMNEPEPFCHKIHLKAYPTVEMGGVHLGLHGPSRESAGTATIRVDAGGGKHRHVSKVWEECNWLRPSKAASTRPMPRPSIAPSRPRPRDRESQCWGAFGRGRKPILEVDVPTTATATPGFAPGEDQTYVRAYHYVMPFSKSGRNSSDAAGWAGQDHDRRAHVGADRRRELHGVELIVQLREGCADGEDRMERGHGNGPITWSSTVSSAPCGTNANNWLIDRQIQKTETFTGIEGINTQDRAVQEEHGTG